MKKIIITGCLTLLMSFPMTVMAHNHSEKMKYQSTERQPLNKGEYKGKGYQHQKEYKEICGSPKDYDHKGEFGKFKKEVKKGSQGDRGSKKEHKERSGWEHKVKTVKHSPVL